MREAMLKLPSVPFALAVPPDRRKEEEGILLRRVLEVKLRERDFFLPPSYSASSSSIDLASRKSTTLMSVDVDRCLFLC